MIEIPKVLKLFGKETQKFPLVFDSPHSGTNYPNDFKYDADFQLIRMGEDTHVNELFSDCIDKGCILLQAEFPRSYIDPNRSETDFIANELSTDYNNVCNIKFAPTIKSKLGIGLIWTKVPPNGNNMYNKKISPDDLMHRVKNFHRPYHKTLKNCLDETYTNFNKFFHVNCHSMSNKASAMSSQMKGTRRPDFVLGDRDGTTCSPKLINLISTFLKNKNFNVTINDPYKGVELVRAYSNPEKNKHSIQIEVNRSLYMNEINREKNEKFHYTKLIISEMIDEIKSNLEKKII